MDTRSVLRQLGFVLILLGGSMILAAAWAVHLHTRGHTFEWDAIWAFALSMLGAIVCGGAMVAIGTGRMAQLGRREALLLVAASWLLGAVLAAAPFRIWAALHEFEPGQDRAFTSIVNCYFEAMSGLTTTGATVLQNIQDVPKSILFWRAFTQWLGGLGIVVLFVAVLPTLGVGGKRALRLETPGPSPEGVRPRIREAAQALWLIYVGLTVAEVIALRVQGLSWYEAFCHTFATLATGGFGTRNESIAGFGSVTIEVTIILFMVLVGVNFGVYYRVIFGKWREALTDPELKTYLCILVAATVLIGLAVHGRSYDTTANEPVAGRLTDTIRYSAFQAVAIQTTTGFCTADSNQWPFAAKALLVALMFVGASAGSTGGGIKVVRVVMLFKVMVAELERVFRPQVVRPVRFGRSVIDHDLQLATVAYGLGLLVLFLAGAALLMAFEPPGEIDFVTAISASAATLNNIGPGLAKVGATENYAWFSHPSKILMSILMVLGRLEVYSVLVLFMPRFWRED